MINPTQIRSDFPIFKFQPKLVYLDSTATALKPQAVINTELAYYQKYSANVFRGIYPLSEKATLEYEKARKTVVKFINASSAKEIIFVRNTTEALNLLGNCLRGEIWPLDEIVTTVAEHHSNFVTWQQLAKNQKAVFKVFSDIDNWSKTVGLINRQTKIVALTYVSNVLGIINDLPKLIKAIRRINPKVIIVVDAAQAAPLKIIDLQKLDCDFLAFSGHKIMGPTGIGVLWGREKLLNSLPPFQFGGEMVETVGLKKSSFKPAPDKFEAGTPNIAGAIGLAAAIKYLEQFSPKQILAHEQNLLTLAYRELGKNKNIVFVNQNSSLHTGILSFYHRLIHPHDLAQIAGAENVCLRAGHHCAQPLHTYLKINATCRASFYIYNNKEDVFKLAAAVNKAEKILVKKNYKLIK